jgi:hypothetical protein
LTVDRAQEELSVVRGKMWQRVDIEEVLHRDNITLIGEPEPVIEVRAALPLCSGSCALVLRCALRCAALLLLCLM